MNDNYIPQKRPQVRTFKVAKKEIVAQPVAYPD